MIKKYILLAECKKLGLQNCSSLKKDELIKLLESNGIKINIHNN